MGHSEWGRVTILAILRTYQQVSDLSPNMIIFQAYASSYKM